MVKDILEKMEQGMICNILAYAYNREINVEIFELVDKIADIRTIMKATNNPRALEIVGEYFLKAAFDEMDSAHIQFKLLREGTHEDCHLFQSEDIWVVGVEEGRAWRSCKRFEILMRIIATDEVLPVTE